MLKVLYLWKDVYATYCGDDESHAYRLSISLFVAIFIAYFSPNVTGAALGMMAVAISILTGFTFTALFSSYSATTSDLPSPKNESDRHDITILKDLEINFRARSKFLILSSMISVVCMVLISVEVYPYHTVKMIYRFIIGEEYIYYFDLFYRYASLIWKSSSFALISFTIFVFFEGLYTFYRLSETVVAALTIRGEYKDSHRD